MSIIKIVNKMKKTVTNIAGPSRGSKEMKLGKKAARRKPALGSKAAVARRASRGGR
tara:strand:+ start:344 stop:511 length:168 start_codon:yes stop_codon:yes gene_type:complete